LINGLYEQITSLRGTHFLAYLVDMSRLLCFVHLVFHPVRRINQSFLKRSPSQIAKNPDKRL
ncbi:hypothetical protein, partial [Nitrosomonas sp.]|uniref:hypothetical protein n=1 Tax=Nitrosomonas sp. TaxID=42353 RepID=UPI0035B165EE